MIINDNFLQMINNPVRSFRGRVEIFEGSTLSKICGCHDILKEFTIERVGESKFFGYGIVQKINVKLLDPNRELNLTTSNYLEAVFGNENNYIYAFPRFNVSEVHRNEVDNSLSITAYCPLYKANEHTVAEITMAGYTVRQFIVECARILGLPLRFENMDEIALNTYYPTGANFDGTEKISDALRAVAEVTQSIFYVNKDWELVFKRLDMSGDAVLNIDKEKYFSLDSGTNRRLATICHATELGDNVSATQSRGTGVAAGKNLLPYPYNETTKTENGITFTDNGDGTITVNGTAEADVEFSFTTQNPEFDWLVHNNYYYISGAQGVSGINMFTEYIDANGVTQQKKGRVVWKDDYTLKRFLVSITNGTTLENAVIQPMVEQAANPTEYEPYTEKVIQLIGTTQYVRDNPFWELREDIDVLLENAVAAVGGFTINQFDCSWRGNFLVEIGDKIALADKNNNLVYSYLLNDVVSFNGSLSEQTQWDYADNEDETASNPSTLGDALKQTYAKVDKVNREILLVASETSANQANISALQIDTKNISASVSSIEENVRNEIDSVNNELVTVKNSVDAKMSAEDVTIAIKSEMANGVSSVVTETGFTFNNEGLRVNKSGSEMETVISDDGMQVFRDNTEMLRADNTGCYAENLHSRTYLIIGTNSRFEDYDNGSRTGCFWIGN